MIGTMVLVLMGCGSAVFAGSAAGAVSAGVGTLGVAFAFGLSGVAMAYAFGGISGCHFNFSFFNIPRPPRRAPISFSAFCF